MSRQFFHNFRWGLTGEVQEMFVQDGEVIFRTAPEPGYIEDAETVDLQGAFVLPAFIDNHCHILPTGLDLAKLHLGACSTREEVLDAVRDRHSRLEPGEWLLAVHYDQTKYPDGRHLTAAEIDAVVGRRPTILRHSNGHASVASSAALKAAGVDSSTPDPKGGTFVRDSAGDLTGVLLETAHERVSGAAPKPDLVQMVNAILAAGQKMAELGICCATDMMTGAFDLRTELRAYRLAIRQGLPIDIRLFLQWSTVLGPRAVGHDALDEFEGPGGRIVGLKIFADGAIGSATAAIYGSFLTTGEDGQLIYSADRLKEMVRMGHEAGYPIAIHTIGDRSTDLVMEAFEATGDPSRHRVEHVMLMSDAQIERLARLGCHATMQPEFLMRFAHSYRRQLRDEQFRTLERFRSFNKAGIPLSLSSDRPIVPGNPWDGILTAANRPEGFDPSENMDRSDGILGYTALAAEGNGDRGRMGTLDAGCLADFCTYEEDPVTAARPIVQSTWRRGSLLNGAIHSAGERL